MFGILLHYFSTLITNLKSFFLFNTNFYTPFLISHYLGTRAGPDVQCVYTRRRVVEGTGGEVHGPGRMFTVSTPLQNV